MEKKKPLRIRIKKHQPILTAAFILLCTAVVLPLLLIVGVSFSTEMDVLNHGYSLIPENFSLDAYKYVFSDLTQLLNAYKVTITFAVLGTVLSVLVMAMFAYPLTQKELPFRNQISFLLYFTMLFSGGLVPTYILITQYLHLNNSIWVYILPGLISPWYVFMMRTFFKGIPNEIFESALMDGADDYCIFFRFVLPLSKPVLATIALYMFLGLWNNWNTSLLYITDDTLYSLQYLLQRIMKNIELLRSNEIAAAMESFADVPGQTARMALVVVAAGPALVVFPFFQKYFTKGITVGSVKG